MTLDFTVPADPIDAGDDQGTVRPARRPWRARRSRFPPTNPHPADGRWGSALRMLSARARREAQSGDSAKESAT